MYPCGRPGLTGFWHWSSACEYVPLTKVAWPGVLLLGPLDAGCKRQRKKAEEDA